MSSHLLVRDTSYSSASSTTEIDPEVLVLNASGFVSVRTFNRIESRRPEAEEIQERTVEPAFGTHLREAIQIIRDWRSPSRG